MARNSFSIIDSNAQKNRITTMFYVCILELIRNWLKTHFLGVMYPFKCQQGQYGIVIYTYAEQIDRNKPKK